MLEIHLRVHCLTVTFDSDVNVRPATRDIWANKAHGMRKKQGTVKGILLFRMSVCSVTHCRRGFMSAESEKYPFSHHGSGMCNASVHHHPPHIISMRDFKLKSTGGNCPPLSSDSTSSRPSERSEAIRLKLHHRGLMGYLYLSKNICIGVVLWQRQITEIMFACNLAVKTLQ